MLYDCVLCCGYFHVIAAVAWLHRNGLVARRCYLYPAEIVATLSVSRCRYDTSPKEKGHRQK